MMVQIELLFPDYGWHFFVLHTLMIILTIILKLYVHTKFGEFCVSGYNNHQGYY